MEILGAVDFTQYVLDLPFHRLIELCGDVSKRL